jgi:hypothetical protein
MTPPDAFVEIRVISTRLCVGKRRRRAGADLEGRH